MITLSRDEAASARAKGPSGPVVWIGGPVEEGEPDLPFTALRIGVSDPELAARIRDHLLRALAEEDAPLAPTVRICSRAALVRREGRIRNALVIVQVRAGNVRYLVEIVGACREAGCRAVQLVWDGLSPSPAGAAPRVFAILEQARSSPGLPPVFLAPSRLPMLHLLPPGPGAPRGPHAHL